MIEVLHSTVDVPVYDARSAAMYEFLDDYGFALIQGAGPHPEELADSVDELKTTRKPNSIVQDFVTGAFTDVDCARARVSLDPIRSETVEVFVKRGFEGADNPHIDMPHRLSERSVEVIRGDRTWHLWLPDIKWEGTRPVVDKSEPDVIVSAESGDTIVFRARQWGESVKTTRARSAVHSYIPSSVDDLTLLHARVLGFDLRARLSAIRYGAPKFPKHRLF